jgi:phosphonate transport system substrate-binding protein
VTKRCLAYAMFLLLSFAPLAYAESYTFGVINVRSALLTAQYWNPILEYVSSKAGVSMELRIGKTAQETSDAEARGEYDFVYTNHIFAPNEVGAGYQVFARTAGEPIQGQIVVAEGSHIRSLRELDGKTVGFPSKTAFVGYAVPMAALLKAGVKLTPVFAGNQEGIMGQLRSGAIEVACVNSKTMRAYAARENFKYRVLWTSEDYLDLPVAVQPRVPERVVKAVRDALVNMVRDPEGLAVLKASAAVVKQEPPYGFLPALDGEYRNQREVYQAIRKLDAH